MVSKSNFSSPRKCEFFFIKIVRTLIVIIIILTEDNFSLRGYHNKGQIFFMAQLIIYYFCSFSSLPVISRHGMIRFM